MVYIFKATIKKDKKKKEKQPTLAKEINVIACDS